MSLTKADVEEATTHQNAFDILMAAQREKMSHVLPDKLLSEIRKTNCLMVC